MASNKKAGPIEARPSTKRTPQLKTTGKDSFKRAGKDSQPKQSTQVKARSESKQSAVLELLKSTKGATIPAIMKATGWQQHSVRGFFAGIVRKKLRLDLVSSKGDGERIYRIAHKSASK